MAWNESGPGRDPWNQGPGGNKRGDGPPDLDEMLKRLKARFGGNKGAPGSGSPSSLPKGLIALGLVVLGVLWVFSGWYVVDEQERALVLRFGEMHGVAEPGLRWHYPWPIERQEIVNVTHVRQINDQATMLTKDENIIDVELTVQYRISSAEDYAFNLDDPDLTLKQATKSAVRETVGQSDMDFILTAGREAIADRTKQLLQDTLDQYHSGLVVTEVNLQQAQPPEAVQSAFADAIKAREDQQRVINEAEAYRNDRLPRARGAAARSIQEANGYRERVVARAQGDVDRFSQLLSEYRKAPQVTRERMYLDTMSSVLSGSNKVLVDIDKSTPMVYLPLQELMKSAPPKTDSPASYLLQPGAAASRANGGSAGMPNNNESRARDRERP
jgi:membrane protease subunit HflK